MTPKFKEAESKNSTVEKEARPQDQNYNTDTYVSKRLSLDKKAIQNPLIRKLKENQKSNESSRKRLLLSNALKPEIITQK